MGENFPARVVALLHLLGINGYNDTLRTKSLSGLTDKFWVVNGRRIDCHLVCTSIQKIANILQLAHTTTHCQGNKHFPSHTLNRMQCGIPVFMTGGNIEKGNFIRALLIVATSHLNRITSIANINKLYAFDYTALIHIKAGNNTLGQTHFSSLNI